MPLPGSLSAHPLQGREGGLRALEEGSPCSGALGPGLARSSARPGGPRAALGITHSQHMFPERGLTPEALGTGKAKRGLPLEEFTTPSHTRECHLG